ncbi:MAG: chromosomal replication initiator protein DnaA [Lachnospiraceae bacterium]|nr:chromosomal replication initiator protein DnaA [Lachnospiraceae bacterium]
MFNKVRNSWDDIIERLFSEYEYARATLDTFLVPSKVVAVDETAHTVTILVPEKTFIGFMKKKFNVFLSMAIEDITGFRCDVIYTFGEEASKPAPKTEQEPITNNAVRAGINPKYTFDSFVVGSNNRMAHAASLAVAESPAEVYNPLFIYGGVGLGKTHLMHSIANFIIKNNPSTRVMYVSSEKFTYELIESIRNKNRSESAMSEFREKYRNNDVLLIDDIQFIVGKEGTQEEFFHTFNTLHDAKKQIIISSDRPPKDFNTLEERLVSRFEWGLTVDIQSPDYETRVAILNKKEEMEGYNIDDEVIKYIANNIKSNIRELEGALTKIVALSKLDNKEIDIKLAEEALKDLISPNAATEISPEMIIQVVSEHYKCSPTDIASKKKNKEIVFPRQVAMYLCRTMTACPLQQIGKYLGNRDHTTIIHGHDKISKELETNEVLANTIEILKKKIYPA